MISSPGKYGVVYGGTWGRSGGAPDIHPLNNLSSPTLSLIASSNPVALHLYSQKDWLSQDLVY